VVRAEGREEVSGRIVDLAGAEVGTFRGVVEMRPWQILTVRVADPSPVAAAVPAVDVLR
jgi:hypothetical protein